MCFYLEFCEYFVFWLQTVVAVTIVDSNLSPICLLVLPNTLPVAATCSWFPVSDALSTINCTSVVNHNIVKHTEAVEKKNCNRGSQIPNSNWNKFSHHGTFKKTLTTHFKRALGLSSFLIRNSINQCDTEQVFCCSKAADT